MLKDFLNTKQNLQKNGNSYLPIDQKVIEKRKKLYFLIKGFNSRGKCLPAETKCETPTNEGEVIVQSSGKPEVVNRNINSADLVCV